MRFSIASMMLATAVAFSANAKKKETKKQPAVSEIPVAEVYEIAEPVTLDAHNVAVKEAEERGKRRVAAETDVSNIEAQYFNDDFMNMRSELIGGPIYKDKKPQGTVLKGVTSPEQLDDVINKYSEPSKYAGLSTQAQFLALQLRGLKPFKSVIFRAQEYVGGRTALRSAIVTLLRNSASGLQAYFPTQGLNLNPQVAPAALTNHWEIVFRYITEPLPGMGGRISTDTDLRNYLTQVSRDVSELTTAAEALVAKKEPIWWDNKLFMSFANFVSEKDRFVKLGVAEQKTILAGMQLSVSGLNSVSAYSLDGLQDAIHLTGNLFGIEVAEAVLKRKPVNGVSSKERFAILRTKPNLFVLDPTDGQNRMANSYRALVKSIYTAHEAWSELRAGKQTDTLFDPQVVIPFNRVLGTSFKELFNLIADKGGESAVVNGEVVRVNLRAFYTQSPRSLQALYPRVFDDSEEWPKKPVNGQMVPYRNYKSGSAIAWDLATYKQYFPDAEPMANGSPYTKDVPKFARILSQTWGGAFLGLPLTSFIF